MTEKEIKWTPCPAPAVADVVRWKEPLWAAPTQKRGKPDQIGEQMLTAEVKAIGPEHFELEVREVEILAVDDTATPPAGVKPGDNVRRKKTSLARGDCHRQS